MINNLQTTDAPRVPLVGHDELISLGAAELSLRIRSGQVSPTEVIDAHIRRIEAVNPAINALVTPTLDLARQEARQAAERLAKKPDDLPPLFGVPITIKDAIPVAGIRFTAGSTFYRDNIAADDAEAVRRLKAAGAIILGKTNCPELSGAFETNNLLFGLTRNPWNLDHSAGGSSGGEGALIAAGGSPLGLGSDIAGSIRIPAAFCGVVGLKPSAGRIPTTGHIPKAPELLSNWNTIGPLARRIEDLAAALSILSDSPIIDYTSIYLKRRRVVIPDFLSLPSVSQEIAGVIQKAADVLDDAGLEVKRGVKLPMLQAALESLAIMYQEWLPGHRLALGAGKAISFRRELMANIIGKNQISTVCLPVIALVSTAGPILHLLGYGQFSQLEKLRRQILKAMGAGGVLLWPVFPTTAPKHGFGWGPNVAPAYTTIFNAVGFPAVAIPLGLSSHNLPLSVQVIGGPGDDETALAVASILEKACGGWQIAWPSQ